MARQVVRCKGCHLNQFLLQSGRCRRCGARLGTESEKAPEPPKVRDLPEVTPSREHDSAQPVVAEVHPPAIRKTPVRMKLPESSLGGHVRTIRDLRGYTQEGLAHASGVPRTYISRVENGALVPLPRTLGRLAVALAVPARVLYGDPSELELRFAVLDEGQQRAVVERAREMASRGTTREAHGS